MSFFYCQLLKKISNLKLLVIYFFLLLNSCALNTGISENPIAPEKSDNITTPNIKIKIIDVNSLNEEEITELNNEIISNTVQIEDVVKSYYGLYDYIYEYQLGPGDEITINLTETDDIDGNYLIDPLGMVDLPYVGKIDVKNLTSSELQNMLLEILSKFYKNPDLQLEIVNFNSSKVYITGNVRNQLVIDLDDKPIRILDAMIKANINTTGNDNLASTTGIIRRDDKVFDIDLTSAIKGTTGSDNFYLKKDDVIFIDRNPNSIMVFGEINRPGSYYPYAGYSLTQLISDSGINQLTADAKNVFVMRENFEEELQIDVFKLNIKNPINLITGRKFLLNKRDIIYIPPSDLVKWNRVISLLLPQTNLFKSYNPIIQSGLSANNLEVQ